MLPINRGTRGEDPREHEGTIQNEVFAYRTLGTYKMNSSKLGNVCMPIILIQNARIIRNKKDV